MNFFYSFIPFGPSRLFFLLRPITSEYKRYQSTHSKLDAFYTILLDTARSEFLRNASVSHVRVKEKLTNLNARKLRIAITIVPERKKMIFKIR